MSARGRRGRARRRTTRDDAAAGRLVFACILAGMLAATTSSAHASEGSESERLQWNEEWPRFRPLELVVTGVAAPVAFAMYYLLPPQTHPHWVGGIFLDDAVRNAVRLRSPAGLSTVRTLSDVIGVLSAVVVVGVDSLLVPVLRGSVDVGIQLGLMDAESFALSSVFTFALYDSIGRARPSYVDCQRDPSSDVQCITSPTASFPSGHVGQVFTAAGLSCAHHGHLPLYGSRLADALACARDVTLAAADGLFRMMGDRHYLTDVLAGASIGFAFGYGLPLALHYRTNQWPAFSDLSLTPMASDRLGIVAAGRF